MVKPPKTARHLPAGTVRRGNVAEKTRILRERAQFAAVEIGDLAPGINIIGFTGGQFSLIDAIRHILESAGPCDVDICVWTVGTAEIMQCLDWRDRGTVTRLRWLIDPSFGSRKPERADHMMAAFGPATIRTINIHAKFVVMRNADWNIAMRTSMNLNPNKRTELFELSDDADIAAFFSNLVDHAFETYTPEESFTTQAAGHTDRMFHGSDSVLPDLPALEPDATESIFDDGVDLEF